MALGRFGIKFMINCFCYIFLTRIFDRKKRKENETGLMKVKSTMKEKHQINGSFSLGHW